MVSRARGRGRGGRGKGGKKSAKQIAAIRKRMPCRWCAKGTCQWGDECRYIHDDADAGNVDGEAEEADLTNFDTYNFEEVDISTIEVTDLSNQELEQPVVEDYEIVEDVAAVTKTGTASMQNENAATAKGTRV